MGQLCVCHWCYKLPSSRTQIMTYCECIGADFLQCCVMGFYMSALYSCVLSSLSRVDMSKYVTVSHEIHQLDWICKTVLLAVLE